MLRQGTIAAAVGVAVVAAVGAHYVALSCCVTRLGIVGLLGYSLRDGYWFDWLLVGVLALSAAAALASFGEDRMTALSRTVFKRSADVLIWAGLAISILVPLCLWAFLFVPSVDRYFDGVWTYEIAQSALVETLMDVTIGALVFALAGGARLKSARRDRAVP